MKPIFRLCLFCCADPTRKLLIRFKPLFFVLILLVLVSGCDRSGGSFAEKSSSSPVSYYTDVPGVTHTEKNAIEELKASREVLTYGSLIVPEFFVQPDGSYGGFTYRFCELLTNLFGIPFEVMPVDDWDALKGGHDEMTIDFIGMLTPTPERMEIYQMSTPITEHALRIFTRRGSNEIMKEADIENLTLGFLSESITALYINKVYPLMFESVDLDSYETAAKKILSGEIDAFVGEEDADTFFLDYNEIESKRFFSMVYSPITVSSANSELAPIISVLNKYLASGGINKLLEMRGQGQHDYAKYKLDRLLTDEEKAYLAGTKTRPVKLALENDNYPVSFYNTSTKSYQGIAIDILEGITNISDIRFEVVSNETMSWTELLDTLESGRASMLTQLLYTDARKGRFLWSSIPYCSSYYALLSRLDYPATSNFQVSLTNVGVLRNSAHEYIFYEWFPEYATAKQYESQSDGVRALDAGEIDLLMASEFMQLSQTNYYENSGLKTNILLNTPLDSYFGFHKDEEVLCSIINKILPDIDTHSIERSWISRNFDYQKEAATERMYYSMVFSAILLIVLVLTIALFVKNKRLNNNLSDIVAKRTFELERQTATLSTIYESIPDILYTVDRDLVYTSCNPSFEKFAGLPRSKIIGNKASDIFIPSSHPDFFTDSNLAVIENAVAITVEEDVVYSNGTLETFEAIKTPLIQNDQLVGMLGIARNITERKSIDERAKLMLNATPLACNLVDKDFNIIDANEESAKLFGLKDKEEYLARFWEIFPERQPDGRISIDAAHEMIMTTLREGRAVFEWMHCMPDDNTMIPSELTLVRTKYGNADAVTGYIRDLREHKKMLAEIDHKDSLLQTVNNAASILLQSETEDFELNLWTCMGMMANSVNADRVYIWKNYERDGLLYCTQLYEWSENVEPQQGAGITIEASYNDVAPGWEEVLSGGRCINGIVRSLTPEEQEALSPQGILSILVAPVFIRDNFWGFVGFDDCHSERVFSEDEVAALRSGSIMIASALLRNEMTVDIQNAVEAAQEASRAKSNFLSNMSHEIRTPLNAITGMTIIGKSASEVKKKDYSLKKIEEASIHLLGVVNDILDMSKIEANKFELSDLPFNFEKMIQKVVGVVNLRIYEKNQNFSVYIDSDIPYAMVGDSQRLSQVITNLLSNAIKFTPENEDIRLSARLLKEESGVCTIQVDVSDTGVGVDPIRQPYIFDSFEQSDNNTARKYGGTGLGLSISKYIVEQMGGQIWLVSELDKGSTFSFTVQIKRGVGKISPVLETDWGDIKILAVDDDFSAIEYFESIADQLGIACDTVSNGRDALRLIDSGMLYDLFFVDFNMPGINGLELSKAIKARNSDKSVIIMISSYDWSEIEKDATEAGVDKFIPKPLFLSAVADCINECFGKVSTADRDGMADEAVSFHGRKILLAEDVEINREIVLSLLEDTGIEIDCAENGIEALKMFKETPERYDLIFMDVQMPEMDGMEATRSIRSLGFAKAMEIPIVAMTANVFREDIEQCIKSGMNDHVGKPLDFDEVLDKLEMYL